MIEDYLALTGHRSDVEGALFRPVKNNRTARLDRHLDPASVYQNIVRKYGLETGLSAEVMACVCIRCVPRQQQTLYRMTPILPRFRSGWGTLTYPRHACMTGAEQARRQSDFSGEILTRGCKPKPLAEEKLCWQVEITELFRTRARPFAQEVSSERR
jgi:hypothetical protein